jgi:predicted RNase H-like HicB family nuclease
MKWGSYFDRFTNRSPSQHIISICVFCTFALNRVTMKELVFLVEESQDGGYFARAVNQSIFTQADTIEELKLMISDAVHCHFDDNEMPELIHLHVTREETFAL